MIPTKSDPGKTVATFFINNSRRYLAFGNFFHIRVTSEDYFTAAKKFLQDADWPVREIGDTDCRIYGVELLGREELAPLFTKLDALTAAVAGLVATSGPMPVSMVNQASMTRTDLGQYIDWNVNQVWAAVTALAAKVDAIAGGSAPTVARLTYTVAAGDTLTKIANRFGASVPQLQEWNAVTDPGALQIGRVLTVSAP